MVFEIMRPVHGNQDRAQEAGLTKIMWPVPNPIRVSPYDFNYLAQVIFESYVSGNLNG